MLPTIILKIISAWEPRQDLKMQADNRLRSLQIEDSLGRRAVVFHPLSWGKAETFALAPQNNTELKCARDGLLSILSSPSLAGAVSIGLGLCLQEQLNKHNEKALRVLHSGRPHWEARVTKLQSPRSRKGNQWVKNEQIKHETNKGLEHCGGAGVVVSHLCWERLLYLPGGKDLPMPATRFLVWGHSERYF